MTVKRCKTCGTEIVDSERIMCYTCRTGEPTSMPAPSLPLGALDDAQTLVEGRKDDQGKLMPRLLPPRALMQAVAVLTFGAEKYDPENWRKVDSAEDRYMDAALRHMFADLGGEEYDDESDLESLAHAIVNLLFVLELRLTKDEP